MRNFEKALAQTLKNEGVVNGKTGYVNSKSDSGGETNYGITKAKARECGYQGKMCNLPYETAKQIYYNEFWKKTNAANMPNFNLAFFLFDFAVNSGVKQAIKHLQAALNKLFINNTNHLPLIIDGIAGNKTKTALMSIKDNYNEIIKLQSILINERLRFYTGLSKTQFNEFGKGWINRIISNIDFLMGV